MPKKKPAGRVFSPANPTQTARTMLYDKYTAHDFTILHYWNGSFYWWASTCYEEIEADEINSDVRLYLEGAKQPAKEGPDVAFMPDKKKVSEVSAGLKDIRHFKLTKLGPPCWFGVGRTPLDGRPAAHELLACTNGLLHLPTGQLLPLDPFFFNLNAVNFAFDPDAPEPERWLKFLGELWPEDLDAILCLQEIFGYMLTPDTSQQKLFQIVGPARAGKGTISRVLTSLVGEANVVSPTLSSLAGTFGRQPLIGKQMAVISNFKTGKNTDAAAIAEHLLTISGEDRQTIPRKHIADWKGKLGVRFFMESNSALTFNDPSGALADRFILLQLTESFLGKEDLGLTKALLGELPGILNWAVEGWCSLQTRGHFEMPKSSEETVQDMRDSVSLVSAFVREQCVRGDGDIETEDLYYRWELWCKRRGKTFIIDAGQFGRDLKSCFPKIGRARPRVEVDGKMTRPYMYTGIRLATDDEKAEPTPPF